MAGGGTLILSDGGPGSLLACVSALEGQARAAEGGHVVIRTTSAPDREPLVRQAVERQAELLGLTLFHSEPKQDSALTGAFAASRRAINALVGGAFAAFEMQIETVVWPETAGPELNVNVVGKIVDRALLAERLVAVEVGEKAPRIRAPYADLTDAQIADLALDMDLPIWTCWWWDGQTPAAAAERDRWMGALRAAGWSGELPPVEVKGRGSPSRPVHGP